VDQKGALISLGSEDEKLIVAAQHLDYTRKVEGDMILRVRRLLAPIVGEDKFKTEISADLDFTEVEEAGESFNPDLPALRSEAVIEEAQVGPATLGGIPGALTNQPPASGVAPEQVGEAGAAGSTKPSSSRSQATRNYELDRTVSYTKHQKGRLRRLSVAVVVDDRITVTEDGRQVRTPWTDQELQRLSILVRDAVGFSAARGDSVNVLNERFVEQPVLADFEQKWWENDAAKFWLKQAVGLLIILVLLVGFLRPVLKSLAAAGKSRADDESRELAALQAAGADSFDSLSDETVTLTGGDALALPSPEEGYEQQLNAVKGLVAEDAGRVAQVIKRWINEE
jgi:flagellar M-ring protein FliF